MTWQVFWLMPHRLPSHPRRGQWLKSAGDFRRRLNRMAEAFYSYGDSAGFAPDFPFNDAGRQPNRRESTAFLGADEKL